MTGAEILARRAKQDLELQETLRKLEIIRNAPNPHTVKRLQELYRLCLCSLFLNIGLIGFFAWELLK